MSAQSLITPATFMVSADVCACGRKGRRPLSAGRRQRVVGRVGEWSCLVATGGVPRMGQPGWACGHARQPCTPPGGSRAYREGLQCNAPSEYEPQCQTPSPHSGRNEARLIDDSPNGDQIGRLRFKWVQSLNHATAQNEPHASPPGGLPSAFQ